MSYELNAQSIWKLDDLGRSIWRLTPLADSVLVGVDGDCRDGTHVTGGLRDVATWLSTQALGATLQLDADGRTTTTHEHCAPIGRFEDDWIGLSDRATRLLRVSSAGKVQAEATPFGENRAIHLVRHLGDSLFIACSGGTTDGISSMLPNCEAAVFDAGLREVSRFRSPSLPVEAASRTHLYGWCEQSQTLRSCDVAGSVRSVVELSDLISLVGANASAGQPTDDQWSQSSWAISFDELTGTVLMSSTTAPHIVASVGLDGRPRWARVIGKRCCAGPIRRIDSELVVSTGCGGCVAWLGDEGVVQARVPDDAITSFLIERIVWPQDVEPGPPGTVFAARTTGLAAFTRAGDAFDLVSCEPRSKGLRWWAERSALLYWTERAVGCMAVSIEHPE